MLRGSWTMSESPRRAMSFQRNLARTIRLTDGKPEVAGARAVPLDVFGSVHALSGALDPRLRPQTVDYPNGVPWPWGRGCFIALSPAVSAARFAAPRDRGRGRASMSIAARGA